MVTALPVAKIIAIVPIKGLDLAKARLARTPLAERQALAMQMAQVSLEALHHSAQVSHTIVVSSDEHVATLAHHLGFGLIADPGEGLNAAYATGADQARADGAETLLMMPSDFLQLTAADIDALVTTHRGGMIGLLACKDGTGTNAVMLPAALPFTPLFGIGSFARHWSQAGELAQRLSSPALAFDIDTDADLALSQLNPQSLP